MSRKLEDVLERRRLINHATGRLIGCYDEIQALKDFARSLGYAVTSTGLPEEAHSIYCLTDSLFWSLDSLSGEIALLIKLMP